MMFKKNNIFIILILCFLNLISFSNQEKHQGVDGITGIDYNHDQKFVEYEVENAKKIQRFRLDLEQGKNILYYMKVEVTVVGDFPTPLLCFSSSDSNCNENREQIVKNPNGKTNLMWLKREQFIEDDQELYIQVICEKEGAGYILRFAEDQAAMYGPNFVYSYYVGINNREMRFEIKGNGESGRLIASIEGSSTATLSSSQSSPIPFDYGKVLIIDIEEPTNSTITTITVKGNTDEYLTLSVHLINENGISNLLEVNGPEVTGLLQKDDLEKECYRIESFASSTYQNINYFYLIGTIHSQIANIYLADENGEIIAETVEVVSNGHLSKVIKSDGKIKNICIDFPTSKYKEAFQIFYTLSILELTKLNPLYNYYPPQITGRIYRRILPKGKIGFYSPMKLQSSFKKYNYNMYSLKGYAKMAIAKCTTFPNCEYNNLNGLEIPKSTNQMTVWTTESDLSSTIGNEKNLIVVQCLDDDNENNGYCIFETSIINKGDVIPLVLDEKFSHYVLEGEKGTFKLNLGVGVKVQRLTVDIMIFSGDVSFNVKESLKNEKLKDEEIQINYHKYLLSNKVFFLFNLAQLSLIELNIEYTASLNSFFTIQFGTNEYNLNQLQEVVPSGENYLVQIDPTSVSRKKTVRLENLRYKKEKPFLANFFALNCDFSVFRGTEEIEFFDGYAQEILTPSSEFYKSETYNYEIKIKEPDLSNYNHKMCMLYVSGLESKDDYEREIIIGENINQQIIFENGFEKVRFLYPQADNRKDLAIHVNVIDQAYYSIKVFLNSNEKEFRSFTTTRTQIIYIPGNDISDICKENQICSVIVQVELNTGKHQFVKTNPMIEITVRQIKNIPSYIQKGIAKIDFTCGDSYYYLYTDIGKNEQGEVLIDFLRDFGNIWGKIVRKDQSESDEEANWRGIYRMPSEDWEDSLEYNKYIKKLLIRAEDTQDCIEGCYLLMSIQISQIGEYVDESKFYPFLILTRITPNNRAYTDIPKVVIQVDEYIIGNVDLAENERIYEFYEVWLPHDADRVDFDWQSEVAGLYINLGGIRPTTKNSDFKLLPPGKHSILSLTKKQILDRAKEKKISIPYENSIQDLSLVISIWTDKTSAVDTELYSLRVHEVNENDKLDIIEVNADKKTICKPHHLTGDEYRCLFMITYDNDDFIIYTPFFGHASSVDASAMTYMYANFVNRELYDEFDNEALNRVIPTLETATYNSKNEGVDYIYISRLDKSKYLFLNIIVDSPEDVMLLTNMPLYNYISFDMFEFYPTPGKEQLLSVAISQLRLEFATEKSILVNIVSLTGEAEISWKNDPNTIYSLRGRGDRLALSSGEASDQLIIRKRNVENNNNSLKDKMEDPGFLFYISYYIKEKQNFDEVLYGKSIEFAYKDTDLPVILFSKIGNYTGSDINVAVTFKDMNMVNSGVYESSPLDVRASLIKEINVYKAKKDPGLAPSLDRLIIGSYDTAIRTAQVMISREIMSRYNFKENDNPTLYLSIEKNQITQESLNKFSIEVQFSKANEGVIPTEKVYHYGRLGDHSIITYYKLRIDKQKPLMRIQTAFNSENVDFIITESFESRKNMTFMSTGKERGKIFITLDSTELKREYLLIIFYKKNTNALLTLYNYAFKYINAKSIDEFVDYKIKEDENITYVENFNNNNASESIINCTFHKINVSASEANITYFLKIVDADSYIEGELSDTIAVTESPYYTVFVRNPEDKKDLITLTAKGDFRRWTIIQIMAQVQHETIVEYVAYKGKYMHREKKEEEEKEEENKNKNNNNTNNSDVDPTMFYVVGGILLALVIGLIVVIIIFKIKNQELVEQVKHVSFQKFNSSNYNNNVDPNKLINK